MVNGHGWLTPVFFSITLGGTSMTAKEQVREVRIGGGERVFRIKSKLWASRSPGTFVSIRPSPIRVSMSSKVKGKPRPLSG